MIGAFLYKCLTMIRPALRGPGSGGRRSGTLHGETPGSLCCRHAKNPDHLVMIGAFLYKCLTMTYSHMGRPHTTIGAERFHC